MVALETQFVEYVCRVMLFYWNLFFWTCILIFKFYSCVKFLSMSLFKIFFTIIIWIFITFSIINKYFSIIRINKYPKIMTNIIYRFFWIKTNGFINK